MSTFPSASPDQKSPYGPGGPPQQQFGPPPGAPPQQQFGPPPGAPPQQQFGPPSGAPPQQQFGPPSGAPPQQHFSSPTQPWQGQYPPTGNPPQQSPMSSATQGAPPQAQQQQVSGAISDMLGTFDGKKGSYRIDHRDCNTLLTLQLADMGCLVYGKPGTHTFVCLRLNFY